VIKSFTAGRVLILSKGDISEADAWKFVEECIKIFREQISPTIVTQPDYDQMYAQQFIRESASILELKTKHDPSAIGTVAAFKALLQKYIKTAAPIRWGVLGVGHLGSRIVNLIANDFGTVFAYDKNKAKLEQFKGSSQIRACSYKEWLNTNPQAIVFAGNSGSLTETMLKTIIKNPQLVVLGGPEAGLDGCPQMLDTLTKNRIHFMPSFLCGSMGLISNLSEIIGKKTLLHHQEKTLVAHIRKILGSAIASDDVFQQHIDSYLLKRMEKKIAKLPTGRTSSKNNLNHNSKVLPQFFSSRFPTDS
jgi:hypothetical protein